MCDLLRSLSQPFASPHRSGPATGMVSSGQSPGTRTRVCCSIAGPPWVKDGAREGLFFRHKASFGGEGDERVPS